jgi:hypothetical protein
MIDLRLRPFPPNRIRGQDSATSAYILLLLLLYFITLKAAGAGFPNFDPPRMAFKPAQFRAYIRRRTKVN